MSINRLPISWFGTKYSLVSWLEEHLPYTRKYADVFGGSAITLVNREPVEIEVYNDVNESLVNYFQIVRKHPDYLRTEIEKTPYSRKELDYCLENYDNPALTDLERARCFYVSCECVRDATLPHRASDRHFSRAANSNRPQKGFNNRPKAFDDIAERFEQVTIENTTAIDILEAYDDDDILFYLDPPYVPDSRSAGEVYDDEMTVEDHIELLEMVNSCEAYIAISGYFSELYDEYLDDWNVYSKETTSKINRDGNIPERENTEVLWTNYDAEEIGGEYIGDWHED